MLCWSLLVAGDQVARQLSGLLLRELVRGASDTFAAHASAALPSAFVACHDEDADVAAIWKDVWEEGTGSPAAAARLYLAEISAIICSGLCTFLLSNILQTQPSPKQLQHSQSYARLGNEAAAASPLPALLVSHPISVTSS